MDRRLLTFALGALMFAACSRSEPAAPAAPPASAGLRDTFAAGAVATMTGRQPGATEVTVQEIDIWSTARLTAVACKLPHGADVTVTGSAFRTEENRWYYEVDGTTCKGWVAETFLEAPPADQTQ